MGFPEVIGLLSGVALFLFGMTLMGDGLKRMSGDKLEPILFKLSGTPIRGVLLGAGVTTVIQSSSATSVMTVGFVNSGMMKLRQAIPVVLGAILGTSITGWIICLSYIEGSGGISSILSTSTLTGVIAVIGVFLRVFSKKQSHHHIGDILMGFAVLMFGMSTMSGSVRGLGDQPWFTSMLATVTNPVLGILVGMVFAAILQSASAAVGIVQALSVTGAMTFGSTLPLLMGISIGASLPVMLTALGASIDGKRVALSYLLSCAIGVAICAVLFYSLNAIFNFPIMNLTMNPFSLALVNTLMRLVMISILLPFTGMLVKLVSIIFRDKPAPEAAEEEPFVPQLESRFLEHPALAVEQSHAVICDMAVQASDAVGLSIGLFKDYKAESVERVRELEAAGDRYEDAIGSYLMEVTRRDLTETQSQATSIYLHTLADFERISDHALNIAENLASANSKKIELSPDAKHELNVMIQAVREALSMTVDAFASNDLALAQRVEPLEEAVDAMSEKMKAHHIQRLQRGQCTIPQGMVFTDLVTDLERVSDHCSNIAVAIIEQDAGSLSAHEYLDTVKEHRTPEFEALYEDYRAKYAL